MKVAFDPILYYQNLPDHLFLHLSKVDDYKVAPPRLLNKKNRKIVIDWLFKVAEDDRCNRVVVHRAVRLMDAYLCVVDAIDKDKIQLVAIAAYLIAAKFDEELHLSLKRCTYYCGKTYSVKEVETAEKAILTKIGWRVCFPLALEWLEHWTARFGGAAEAKQRLDTFLADPDTMALPVWRIAEKALKNKESL